MTSITEESTETVVIKRNYQREYYYRNLDLVREKGREYYYTKVKGIKKYKNEWRKNNRLKLIALLGNKCIKCGFSDIRALQLDHINNDGHIDRKKFKCVQNYYFYYCKHEEMARKNLQVLCANCNWIRRYECKKHNQHYVHSKLL